VICPRCRTDALDAEVCPGCGFGLEALQAQARREAEAAEALLAQAVVDRGRPHRRPPRPAALRWLSGVISLALTLALFGGGGYAGAWVLNDYTARTLDAESDELFRPRIYRKVAAPDVQAEVIEWAAGLGVTLQPDDVRVAIKKGATRGEDLGTDVAQIREMVRELPSLRELVPLSATAQVTMVHLDIRLRTTLKTLWVARPVRMHLTGWMEVADKPIEATALGETRPFEATPVARPTGPPRMPSALSLTLIRAADAHRRWETRLAAAFGAKQLSDVAAGARARGVRAPDPDVPQSPRALSRDLRSWVDRDAKRLDAWLGEGGAADLSAYAGTLSALQTLFETAASDPASAATAVPAYLTARRSAWQALSARLEARGIFPRGF
jgi:hypothetical protein